MPMLIFTGSGWRRVGGAFVPGPQRREAGDGLVFRPPVLGCCRWLEFPEWQKTPFLKSIYRFA